MVGFEVGVLVLIRSVRALNRKVRSRGYRRKVLVF